MNISSEAIEYLAKERTHDPVRQRTEAENFFLANGLPVKSPFIECISEVGGMKIETPTNSLYFVSLETLRRSGNRAKADYFDHTEKGYWFNACDTMYPGNSYLHENGSFYYECDFADKWSQSLASILEAGALMWSVGKESTRVGFFGTITNEGVGFLEHSIEQNLVGHASDHLYRYYKKWGGIIVLFGVDRVQEGIGCGFRALLPSMEAVEEMKTDLRGLIVEAKINQSRD